MVEILKLSEEEKIKRIWVSLIGTRFVAISYIREKVGEEGIKEIFERMAGHLSSVIKKAPIKAKGALKFAIAIATEGKNLTGAEIKVEGDEERALVKVEECGIVRHGVLEAIESAGIPLTKGKNCAGCMRLRTNIARNLGL